MLIIIIILEGCSGNYQYERQPPASFTHCNPVRTILSLECTVLIPRDSTTVTVDWYWSKNISECGRNITEEQGRFDIYTSRGYGSLFNIDRITTDLTIESPQTDTGYYWCQVNDPSYNGVFISSKKAPVFDTRAMMDCNGKQSVIMITCGIILNINTPSPLMCFISTQTVSPTMYNNMLTSRYSETAMSISDIKSMSSTVTITVTTVSGNTPRKSLIIATDLSSTQSIKMYTTTLLKTSSNSEKHTSEVFLSHESSRSIESSSQLTLVTYTNCSNSNDNDTIELISGLVVLSVIMVGLGGVLGGLLTVLWNKKRGGKGRAVVIILLVSNNIICGKLIDMESPVSKGMRSVN